MKTRMAKLAVHSVAVAIGATLLGAVTQGTSLASTQVQSVTDFQSLSDSDLLLSGPVDQVNAKSFQITLLGQTVVVPSTQHQVATDGIIGRIVAVYGSVASDGSLKVSQVNVLDTGYVPGATKLFIKGQVTSSDQIDAVARLGSTSISYANALHTLSAERVSVGTVVSFSGVEFAGSSKFFADYGAVVASRGQSGSDQLGQSGSDKASNNLVGQSGSDQLGQSGSDKISSKALGQSGSDQLGQSGSDHLGQSGSDHLGQSGSDHLGQSGSDHLGQSGSDQLGQSGSDKASSKLVGQSGSDQLGQSGSDELGQSGSDKASGKLVGQSGSDQLGQSGSDQLGQSGSDKISSKVLGQSGSDQLGQSGSD